MDNSALDRTIDQQIGQCLHLLREALGEDLFGVYLYGSSIVGGLQRYSDLDLFVVSARSTSREEKAHLVKELLKISGVYRSTEKRPIEMTIVVQSEVNPWHYPPTFDFQYGDWLRSEFASGDIEPWSSKEMPDLALLVTQVLLASKTIYGEAPEKLLAAVPYKDFMTATVKELDSLLVDIETDTRNVLLTLARIWSTVETDAIRSKQQAAEWASERIPDEWKPVLQHALLTSLGEGEENWDDSINSVQACANFMVDKIKKKAAELDLSEASNKSIKLVE